MAIAFEEMPANALVPLFYAEVVSAQTPLSENLKVLLVGIQNHSLMADTTNHPTLLPYLLSETIVKNQFGNGSMLHWMYRAARNNAPFVEVWGMSMAESSAAAATASITVAGNPIGKTGNVSLMIAGKPVTALVRPTDTSSTLAIRIRNAVNAASIDGARLPCTAVIDSSDPTRVNLTSRFWGSSANGITVTTSSFGVWNQNNYLLTTTNFTGGAGDGSLANALAALGEQRFDVIAVGTVGSAGNLDALDDYFNPASGSWSPFQQRYGHSFVGTNASYAASVTLGDTRNGPHVTIMGTLGSVTPFWEWVGAVSARAAQHGAAPPEISRPLQSLELIGILPPIVQANWPDRAERQILLESGIATYRIDPDLSIRIERLVTTYKTNVWGDPDGSWRDTETMFQAQYFVRYLRSAITGAFPRAALTSLESGIPGFASPGQIKDVIIHAYKTLERQGVVENSSLFARALVVERNASDASRVDILARIDMVNQLRVVATLVETNLQFDPTSPVFQSVSA